VGKGALLAALAHSKVDRSRIVGLDLASTPENADCHGKILRGIEFLAWAARSPLRFDRVIANPPFIALSQVPSKIQAAAAQLRGPDGSPVPKGANCWFAFICGAMRLLTEGGNLGFVLPAAYEYANYAKVLRQTIASKFKEVTVHRCRSPIFENADDGAVVLVCKGFGESSRDSKRIEYTSLDQLVSGLRSTPASGGTSRKLRRRPLPVGRPFNQVMSVQLGAVTGKAEYFLLTEAERNRRSLPLRSMVPVVTRARQVRLADLNDDDWRRLAEANERIWLFRPTASQISHPSVKRYLSAANRVASGVRDGYKVQLREPWYQTSLPTRPQGFLSGMSQVGPWICLNRTGKVNATNTLYVVQFLKAVTTSDRAAWALMLLTTNVRHQIDTIVRRYPLGLRKLEPGDLCQLVLPIPKTSRGALGRYRLALKHLLSGDEAEASRIADKLAQGRLA
jgi:adenine-specific DNA-methyltransferase